MSTSNGGSVTVIAPAGEDAVLNVTKTSGATVTAYSDVYLTTTVTLPVTFTSSTTVYLPDVEEHVVSVLVNGQERATDAGTTRTFLARNGANLTFGVTAGPAAGGSSGALASGHYYFTTSQSNGSSSSVLAVGTLRLTPFYVPHATTVSKIGAEVTVVGEAGSKVRLGIYSDTGKGYPGALLVDAGTINGDSATVQEITLETAQALAPGLYWVGGAVQVVTTTQPTVRTVNVGASIPTYVSLGTSIPTAGLVTYGFAQASVTGALPATFSTTVTVSTIVPRVFVKIA